MSDDIQKPNPELEATLPVEQHEELEAESLESESLEQGQFDEASNDFANEEHEDSDDEFDDGDVEAFDYDSEPDEIVAVIELVIRVLVFFIREVIRRFVELALFE